MDTELLNDYRFATLLTQWATGPHDRRVTDLIANGTLKEKDRESQPITEADLREGLAALEQRRHQVIALLREAGQAPQ